MNEIERTITGHDDRHLEAKFTYQFIFWFNKRHRSIIGDDLDKLEALLSLWGRRAFEEFYNRKKGGGHNGAWNDERKENLRSITKVTTQSRGEKKEAPLLEG